MILWNPENGKRVYRNLRERILARTLRLNTLAWAIEIAGVALIAAGGWLVHPAIGLIIAGAYFVVVAIHVGDD